MTPERECNIRVRMNIQACNRHSPDLPGVRIKVYLYMSF